MEICLVSHSFVNNEFVFKTNDDEDYVYRAKHEYEWKFSKTSAFP
jgi:hypothetical protein